MAPARTRAGSTPASAPRSAVSSSAAARSAPWLVGFPPPPRPVPNRSPSSVRAVARVDVPPMSSPTTTLPDTGATSSIKVAFMLVAPPMRGKVGTARRAVRQVTV